MIELSKIRTADELLRKAKWLEDKTLSQITEEIKKSDSVSRVITKGDVGYVIEQGFFGIGKNSNSKPDIEHLGVEIKTCPLKYNTKRDRLSVKEPLSLNIIDYMKEDKLKDITESALYTKNKRILFIFYIHDKKLERSQYLVKYVFLWDMDERVLNEFRPDYRLISKKISEGRAHEIHQTDHRFLTLCPKHSGCFKDPECKKSKRPQPHSRNPAEIRAFRLKVKYMNLIVSNYLKEDLGIGGWKAD